MPTSKTEEATKQLYRIPSTFRHFAGSLSQCIEEKVSRFSRGESDLGDDDIARGRIQQLTDVVGAVVGQLDQATQDRIAAALGFEKVT